MRTSRRTFMLGCTLATGLRTPSARAQAAWPSRPVTYIVPFAPGGATDLIGRVLTGRMGAALGVPFAVVNRPGAGGNIGAAALARAPVDGYTIGGGSIASHAINASLYDRMPYDTLRDFTPITLIGTMPNLLIVKEDKPYRSLKDLLEAAQARRGSLTYASAGNGTSQHLSTELLKLTGGLDVVHVPYKGAGPALQAVLAGEVDFSFENSSVAAPHVQGGLLRALAISSARRAEDWPDIPTVQEQGFPGYEVTSWQGMFGPAGLDPQLVQRINVAARDALRDDEVAAGLRKLGVGM